MSEPDDYELRRRELVRETGDWQAKPVTQAEFFSDKAHGVKMIRIALWIIANQAPMSGKSVHAAMAELGIDEIQPRNEREIFGIVGHLRKVAPR